MKLKNVAVVAAALALAVGMTACGGSASYTTLSSKLLFYNPIIICVSVWCCFTTSHPKKCVFRSSEKK